MARNGKTKTHKHKSLPFIQADAAGIDIGASEIYVAVPEERDIRSVRKFAPFTEDLHRLADWLIACSIKTVAMESTGVYWIALFQILERRGFEVCLVNARHVKGVPGRKTDIQDCQYRSGSALGDYFRRLRAKHGSPVAITAAAHKLARILFAMLRDRRSFDPKLLGILNEKHLCRRQNSLRKYAASLGFELVPVQNLANSVS